MMNLLGLCLIETLIYYSIRLYCRGSIVFSMVVYCIKICFSGEIGAYTTHPNFHIWEMLGALPHTKYAVGHN
jgi:hypothetical protein